MSANTVTMETFRESEVLWLGPVDNPLAGLSRELHGGADHQQDPQYHFELSEGLHGYRVRGHDTLLLIICSLLQPPGILFLFESLHARGSSTVPTIPTLDSLKAFMVTPFADMLRAEITLACSHYR